MPFGGGIRRCVGAAFALDEMRILLATLFSRLDIELVDDEERKVTRRGLTMGPGRPVIVRVKALVDAARG